MTTDNYLKCLDVLDEKINYLAKLDCEILDMEQGKCKVSKAHLKREKAHFTLLKEQFRGFCEFANLTGEFTYPDGRSSIPSEFAYFLQ